MKSQYCKRREGDTLFIDSFGELDGLDLRRYLSVDRPEITKLIVKCPVLEAMKPKGIDVTGSNIREIIFEQGRNNLPVKRAAEHKVVITDKTIVNIIGNKRPAETQPEFQPRANPSVVAVQTSSTSSVSQNSYLMPTFGQPPKPAVKSFQSANPSIAAAQTSSTSSTSQFVMSKPLERPAMTNQPPKPTFAAQKSLVRPANPQPPRPILSTPASKAAAKPVAQELVQKPVSDSRYASKSDIRPQTSSSSSSSNQLHRTLSQQDIQILAAMGYSEEDFNELIKKEYDLSKVSALLRPVLAKLLAERVNSYNKARLHQIVGLSEYADALANNKPNALFQYATGSGKTFMFTQLASAFRAAHPNKSITILVPTQILRDQTLEAFNEFAPSLNVNVIGDGRELEKTQNSGKAQVNIMTYQLAMTGENKEKAQRLLANSSAVIMDEAHYALPYMNNNLELKQSIAGVPTLAFTATPEFNLSSAARGGLNDVNKLIGYDRLDGDNPISTFNVVSAIKAKANCPVKCLVVFPESVAGLADEQISDNGINAKVSKAINTPQNNRMVADLLLNKKDDGEAFRYQKAIGFCSGTKHADDMAILINSIPNIVSIVDPNGLMRMKYALNLFKKKMSTKEHQIDEIQNLVSGILACEAGKSNDDLMQQEIQNCIDSTRARAENIETVSNAISECIQAAYADFKVASAVHSKKNKKEEPNDEELEQYKLGGTRFMFGDQMLIAGFDDPATSIILNINPTASEPAAIQRAGRGLRLDKNNPNKVCKIIDFDWGMKQQRLFYEYLGNDENGNPNLQLGDMPAMPAPMEVEPIDIEEKTKYSVVSEYRGGQIEISHKTLRKKQRQQEEVDKVRQSKLGVVLEASVTKFNDTLKILELLKQKLAQKLNRGESVVVDNDSSATLLKKRSASEDDSSENRKVKRPKTEKQSRSVVMQGRYTRDMSKQIQENVVKAQEMIKTINEFFETLELNPSSNAAPANTSRSSTNSTKGKGGTSIYEINMDSELQKFTTAASNLTGLVKKLQGMMKLNTLTVGSSAVASTSMQPAGIDEQNQEEARGALVSLIENMNSIQNSSILEDKYIENLIAHSKQKKQESEEQKKQEELRKNQVEDNRMAEDAPQQETQADHLVSDNVSYTQNEEVKSKDEDDMNQSLPVKVTIPLITAIRKNNTGEIKRLIANGADVNQITDDYQANTPLLKAIKKGSTEAVEVLLLNKANTNFSDRYGLTPLYSAASLGHTDIVKILIKYGADVNAKRHKGKTAFDVAKNEEIRNLLLVEINKQSATKIETQADQLVSGNVSCTQNEEVEEKDEDDKDESLPAKSIPPIFLAINRKDIGEIKSLIASGADVNQVKGRSGYTPLRHAILKGYTEAVEVLLQNKANVDSADFYGETPLYFAASRGRTEIVKILIKYGANVNAKRQRAGTALNVAKNEEIRNLLLAEMNKKSAEKIESSQVNNDDDNVEFIGGNNNVRLNHFTFDNMRLLNEENKDIRALDGLTPLMYLAKLSPHEKQRRYLLRLLDLKPDLNAVNSANFTALHFAAGNQHDGDGITACLLVENGADVSSVDICGKTALHYASDSAKIELVNKILHKNTNVLFVQDNEGKTALHCAINYHTPNLKIIKLLIKADQAVAQIKDKSGKTALDYAEQALSNKKLALQSGANYLQDSYNNLLAITELLRGVTLKQTTTSAVASTSAASTSQRSASSAMSSASSAPNQHESTFGLSEDNSKWINSYLNSSFEQELPDQFNPFEASTAILSARNPFEPVVLDEFGLPEIGRWSGIFGFDNLGNPNRSL